MSLYKPDIKNTMSYNEVDESIKDLVFALTCIGLQTGASCEGHLNDRNRHTHPWVKFVRLDCDFLDGLLERYNKTRDIKWHVRERVSGKVIEPINYNENCFRCHSNSEEPTKNQLVELQISANELAHYLYEEYKSS
ncbi:hypothetical protein HYZ41_00505 [archaeon]|nr:hypothetical protein [archaeon]